MQEGRRIKYEMKKKKKGENTQDVFYFDERRKDEPHTQATNEEGRCFRRL